MKLTKGKITKLLNKKRQSKKNYKNKKVKTKNRRTFRKKRNINLSNKTLKNYRYKKTLGGDIESNKKIESTETETTQPVEPKELVQPVTSIETGDTTPIVNEEPIIAPQPPPPPPTPTTTEESLETNDTTPIVNEEPFVSTPPPPPPPTTEEVTLETNDTTPIVNEESIIPPPPLPPIEETTQELPEEVSKSINTVMEFVTSKIANKINIDIDNEKDMNNVSSIQDGFDALNETNKTFISSPQNGGKPKKFRLTKKSRNK